MKKTGRKKIDKKFKVALLLVLTAAVIISIFNAVMIIRSAGEYNEGTKTYDEIRDSVIDEQKGIDFDALKQINDDVIGWLRLDGTVIDYPVVQGDDNEYYLHHLYTGEWNGLGSLFLDYRNRELFQDQISVIYGHSMRNGSMLFILERYKRQSFYDEHKQLVLETPGQTYILEPIAGKVMDARIPFLQFNFDSLEEYEEYVDEYIRTSTFKSDASFDKDDRIVMLIKCTTDYEDARYVLLCKVSEA